MGPDIGKGINELVTPELLEANGAEIVEKAEERSMPNQTLIDPHSTPENLRTFAFGVACPCPTRSMSRETAIALRNLAYPMFGNPIHYSPDGLEVGDARNFIVEQALKDGVEWLLFLDYDVAPPANALVKLLDLKTDIAAGVYNSKAVPSYPLIYVKGWNYAFEDWIEGDLIKADGAGMGCTLIKMDVFKKIKRPWFRTVKGYSPHNLEILGHLTEDIYFCEKAKAAGYDIIIDTSVQCSHVDTRTGLLFQRIPDPNDKAKGKPGWIYRKDGQYVAETLASADHPNAAWADTTPPPVVADYKSIDLGSGPVPPPGFTGIDKFSEGPNVVSGDIADLSWFRKKHGFVKKLRASHSLEHMRLDDVPTVFRDWVNTLAPNGTMEIRVPDGEYHMRAIIERIDEGTDDEQPTEWLIRTLFGLQIGEGQEHHILFTAKRLEQLARTSGLVEVKVEKVVNEGDGAAIPTTAELVLTGRRRKKRTTKKEV
jgi:predicted SAM-dependent methyltransferase